MRIELNAGGLSGGIAIHTFQNDLSKVTKKIDNVVSAFQTVKNKTNALTGGVGQLGGAISGLESRLKTETQKQEKVQVVQEKVSSFIDLALKIDGDVASKVSQNEKALFQKYPSLKPVLPEEKKWYEEIWKIVVLSPVGYAVTKLIDHYVRKNIGDRTLAEFIFDTLHSAVDASANFLKKAYTLYENTIGKVRDAVVDTVLAVVGEAGKLVAWTIGGIVTLHKWAPIALLAGATYLTQKVGRAVVTGITKCVSAVADFAKEAWGTIKDVGSKLLKSIGPVVAIVGGIAMLATCFAAAPIGILAVAGTVLVGLFAANSIANASADLYHIWFGNPDMVGKTNFLKMGVTAVTGGIGSLFGQKELGIKIGNIIYTAAEVTSIVISLDMLRGKLVQHAGNSGTLGGTLKNIKTGLGNAWKELPEGIKGLQYIVTKVPILDIPYQMKLLSFSVPALTTTLSTVKTVKDFGENIGKIGDAVGFTEKKEEKECVVQLNDVKGLLQIGDKFDEISNAFEVMRAF